jgi:hypothetical protein
MESTCGEMKWAQKFLDSLPIHNSGNALWTCLHIVVWHERIDRVMWLKNNKELAKKSSR